MQSYEFGVKAGKTLAQQLRQRKVNQSIPAINNEIDVQLTDPLEINHCFCRYSSKLYTSES